MLKNRSFASDNYSGVHPKILEKICEINVGHVKAYGEDPYTEEAKRLLKEEFGENVEIVFVYNGTGANVLALDILTDKYSSIICTDVAHINTHEVGAPVRITGCPLFPTPNKDGKIQLEEIKKLMIYKGGMHHSQGKVISITQPTELGTIYTREEILELSKFAHENDMLLHMDGARFSNAVVAQESSLKELSGDLGVDILTFGGTKNGLMFGEAIIIFNTSYQAGVKYLKKQNLQLHSKMRFLSGQFLAYMENGLWYENAKNSNDMAKLLEEKLKTIGISIVHPLEANTLYVKLPLEIIEDLQNEVYFYLWDEKEGIVRLVTNFDTTPSDIELFIEKIIHFSK